MSERHGKDCDCDVNQGGGDLLPGAATNWFHCGVCLEWHGTDECRGAHRVPSSIPAPRFHEAATAGTEPATPSLRKRAATPGTEERSLMIGVFTLRADLQRALRMSDTILAHLDGPDVAPAPTSERSEDTPAAPPAPAGGATPTLTQDIAALNKFAREHCLERDLLCRFEHDALSRVIRAARLAVEAQQDRERLVQQVHARLYGKGDKPTDRLIGYDEFRNALLAAARAERPTGGTE